MNVQCTCCTVIVLYTSEAFLFYRHLGLTVGQGALMFQSTSLFYCLILSASLYLTARRKGKSRIITLSCCSVPSWHYINNSVSCPIFSSLVGLQKRLNDSLCVFVFISLVALPSGWVTIILQVKKRLMTAIDKVFFHCVFVNSCMM
jgi:hypothetical protein